MLLILPFLLLVGKVNTQGVTNTTATNANAMLDITSMGKGNLLPEKFLASTSTNSQLSAHVVGTMVYNLVAKCNRLYYPVFSN